MTQRPGVLRAAVIIGALTIALGATVAISWLVFGWRGAALVGLLAASRRRPLRQPRMA